VTQDEQHRRIGCGCEEHEAGAGAASGLAFGELGLDGDSGLASGDLGPNDDSRSPFDGPGLVGGSRLAFSDLGQVGDSRLASTNPGSNRYSRLTFSPLAPGEGSRPPFGDPVSDGDSGQRSSRRTANDLDSGTGSRRRFLRTIAGLAVGAPALLATACSSSSSPSSPSSKPSSRKAGGEGDVPATATPSTAPSSGATPTFTPPPANGRPPGPETADAALLAAKYHGLKPFAPAPPPPSTKPVNTAVPLPPVIDHIPTDQKICFLTIDDGGEKDPAFIDMVKDFRIPFTMFLAECFIHTDYEYFAKLRDTGYSTIQNHTLSHPNMVTLTAQRQLAEISGQQQKIEKTYNTKPYLFRAPFGNSNKATQEACKQNNIKAICYWRASFQKQGFQWQAADKKLRPGDILLAHFRGPKTNGAGWPQMHELMTNLFRIVQDQGYTFARLEDYV
jgi:peptidoglycan/xylan/chitin deacetylase (PgdA/CDA1 family)